MIKTQIQIPDRLYHEAKRIAREREMSFAEVVRRGIECVLTVYPPNPLPAGKWSLPQPRNLGWKGLTSEQLRDLATETTTESQAKHTARRHAVR